MKCPACNNQLVEVTVGNVAVDLCKGGCGGIWLDNQELKKLDEPHELAGDQLLDISMDPAVVVDAERQRFCAKCEGQPMLRHFMSSKKEVAIDECPACGSIWLDCGELNQIRQQFTTEADRKKATLDYMNRTLGSEMDAWQEKEEQGLEKAQKFANMFRFICPSYYIPGKQAGGAF